MSSFAIAVSKAVSGRIGELGFDAFFEAGELAQRLARRQGQDIRGRIEDPRMVQKRPQRHMLGIEVQCVAFGLVRRDQHHAGGVGPSQQDLEAVPVAQLGDPMEVGDQPLGVVLLRAGEERQQGLPRMRLIAVHRRKIEPPDAVAMAA